MRVKWLELALDDMDALVEYIKQEAHKLVDQARENPHVAQRIAKQIWKSGESLVDNPNIGRPGRIQNSREWVISQTPYLLAVELHI